MNMLIDRYNLEKIDEINKLTVPDLCRAIDLTIYGNTKVYLGIQSEMVRVHVCGWLEIYGSVGCKMYDTLIDVTDVDYTKPLRAHGDAVERIGTVLIDNTLRAAIDSCRIDSIRSIQLLD